jgi:hypothetical protein
MEKTFSTANDALAAVKVLTSPDSSLSKTLKNAENITGQLSANKDLGGTLHNLRETSVQLNAAVAALSVQFKTIGQNLTEATDTVKRQPWRLIWPSTKQYNAASPPTPTPARPTPSPRRKPSRGR